MFCLLSIFIVIFLSITLIAAKLFLKYLNSRVTTINGMIIYKIVRSALQVVFLKVF
jgi:hypothetical protein